MNPDLYYYVLGAIPTVYWKGKDNNIYYMWRL